MTNVDITSDDFIGMDYDSRGYLQPQTWPVAVDQRPQRSEEGHDLSPLQTSGHTLEQSVAAQDPNLMVDWQLQHFQQTPHQPQHLPYSPEDPSSAPQFTTASYGMAIQSSPVDLMAGPQGQMSASLLDGQYLPLSSHVDMVPFTYHDFQADLMAFPDGFADVSPYTAPHAVLESSSPTDTYLEVRSLSSSDNGWSTVDHRRSLDFTYEQGVFVNPTQTLHDRSLSESSYSTSYGSFVDIGNPISSPSSETHVELPYSHNTAIASVAGTSPPTNLVARRDSNSSPGSRSPSAVSPSTMTRPIPVPIKKSTSPTRSSGSSSASPPSRKPSRKSPIAAKTSETKVRKQSQTGKAETEKRIGKRKGPLKPDQRKQASEIRKLRACLRCKFLKKTVSISFCFV